MVECGRVELSGEEERRVCDGLKDWGGKKRAPFIGK